MLGEVQGAGLEAGRLGELVEGRGGAGQVETVIVEGIEPRRLSPDEIAQLGPNESS